MAKRCTKPGTHGCANEPLGQDLSFAHPWVPGFVHHLAMGTHGHPWLNGAQNLAPLGVQMKGLGPRVHLHTQGCQVLCTT